MAVIQEERSNLLDVLARLLGQAERRNDTVRATAIRAVMRQRRDKLAQLDEHDPSVAGGAPD